MVGKAYAQAISGSETCGDGELQVVGKQTAGLKVDGVVADDVAVAYAEAGHLAVGVHPAQLD